MAVGWQAAVVRSAHEDIWDYWRRHAHAQLRSWAMPPLIRPMELLIMTERTAMPAADDAQGPLGCARIARELCVSGEIIVMLDADGSTDGAALAAGSWLLTCKIPTSEWRLPGQGGTA